MKSSRQRRLSSSERARKERGSPHAPQLAQGPSADLLRENPLILHQGDTPGQRFRRFPARGPARRCRAAEAGRRDVGPPGREQGEQLRAGSWASSMDHRAPQGPRLVAGWAGGCGRAGSSRSKYSPDAARRAPSPVSFLPHCRGRAGAPRGWRAAGPRRGPAGRSGEGGHSLCILSIRCSICKVPTPPAPGRAGRRSRLRRPPRSRTPRLHREGLRASS